MNQIEFTIWGGIKGGKNNYIVTRSGRHVPRPDWTRWRDKVVRDLKFYAAQIKHEIITIPCYIYFGYFPPDKRRRDVPAILDSVFHCLERAGIVQDDFLFKNVEFYTFISPTEEPRLTIKIEW